MITTIAGSKRFSDCFPSKIAQFYFLNRIQMKVNNHTKIPDMLLFFWSFFCFNFVCLYSNFHFLFSHTCR